jgi:hypothetical protein
MLAVPFETYEPVGSGGTSFCTEPDLACLFCPKEKARPARDLKEGGGGRGASTSALMDCNIGVVADLRGKSSSCSSSRSWSTEDGRVEDELCRADAEDES